MLVDEKSVEDLDMIEVARSILDSRNNTLSSYKEVMSLQPFEDSAILRESLEDLCEQLVDYSGKIHFNLLNSVTNEVKNEAVLQKLVENTQKILDFQDAYNSDVDELHLENLIENLNLLGEAIADRIVLEDSLL